MEGGNGVVIMINGENFAVISELLNSVAIVYDWKGFFNPIFKKSVTVPKDTLQKYTGNYLMIKDTITLLFCGEKLCIQQNREPKTGYQVYFSDNRNFTLLEVPNAAFTVIRNTEGKVEALDLKQGSTKIRLPKINLCS